MISTWLMEIYLNQLGTLKEEGDRQKSKFDMMRDEFRGFLEDSRVMVCKLGTRKLLLGRR